MNNDLELKNKILEEIEIKQYEKIYNKQMNGRMNYFVDL